MLSLVRHSILSHPSSRGRIAAGSGLDVDRVRVCMRDPVGGRIFGAVLAAVEN